MNVLNDVTAAPFFSVFFFSWQLRKSHRKWCSCDVMFEHCSTFSSLYASYNSYSFYVSNFALVEELVLVAQLQRQNWKQLFELIKDPFFKWFIST